MENEKSSDFMQEIRRKADEMMELSLKQKEMGAECGIIVIALNREEGSDTTENVLMAAGKEKAIMEGLFRFSSTDQTKELFDKFLILLAWYRIEKLKQKSSEIEMGGGISSTDKLN